MTVAVHPGKIDRFLELSALHEVESSVIGRYEATGKLDLRYKGKTAAYLDLGFFTEEFPQWEFEAHWTSPEHRGLFEPVLGAPGDYAALLREMLRRPNVCSREWIQRQFDHEVQGGSVIKPYVGRRRDVPSDAAVLRPILPSERGLAVAQSLHPTYSLIDTYHMVAATIDEAVRRVLAVGGKLDEIGGVDNFCWPTIQYDPVENPDGRYKAAQLVRANWALRDVCLAFGIPLLSGKDSMYVDGRLPGRFGERHKVSGLPTMQFTATAIVPDISRCLTLEPKAAGDLLYAVGVTRDELGASEYYESLGYVGLNVPRLNPEEVRPLYAAIERAVADGVPASCHGIYRGGLGVHAALMCFGSGLGMRIDLSRIPAEGDLREDRLLFSESCGRFLVTVPPSEKGRMEELFEGLACALVGEVLEEPLLLICGAGGRTLVNEDVARLKEAWIAGAPQK